MPLGTLRDLLAMQLHDLYSAEQQLLAALPKIADASTNEVLAGAVREHLEETRAQVARLEEAFVILGISPKAEKCLAMEGLIKDGTRIIRRKDAPAPILDAALVVASRSIEHYEIVLYTSAIGLAKKLGIPEVATLLIQSVEEEKAADQALCDLAEYQVTPAAVKSEAAAIST